MMQEICTVRSAGMGSTFPYIAWSRDSLLKTPLRSLQALIERILKERRDLSDALTAAEATSKSKS